MTDPPNQIVIRRTTGTHADVLAAVGLADLLSVSTGPPARLIEVLEGFAVRPTEALSDQFFAQLSIGPGYPFLQANERVLVPPYVPDAVDYKHESARVKEYRALRQQMRRSPEMRQDEVLNQRAQQLAPRSDWPLLQALNILQGDETSNRAHSAIAALSAADRHTIVARGVAAMVGGMRYEPPWKAKLVQVFTPTAAKGYARLKPDSTDRGDSTKEQWVDPFLEWLKYRGYFLVACPYSVGAKPWENIRLLCPIPADISVTALTAISTDLRRATIYGSPPKIDSLAVLGLAQLLIRRSADYHPPDVPGLSDLLLTGRTPARVVSGVMITHYQSLGSAKAVSAMSTLALPHWFTISDAMAAQDWLDILDEHRRVILSLKDDHSDEIGLIVQYRRFLERRAGPALSALLDFMGAYGQFLIRAREQKRRVAAFTTKSFRRLVMGLNAEYTKILDDPGFAAVAAAVRRATVSAQAMKAMGQRDYREIRYDLIPELRRKRALSDSRPFVEVVAEFVSAYNVENARRREMKKPAPANVTTEELASFFRQVEFQGASLVGALLCAYGTCRSPREAQTDNSQVPSMVENGPDEADSEEID